MALVYKKLIRKDQIRCILVSHQRVYKRIIRDHQEEKIVLHKGQSEAHQWLIKKVHQNLLKATLTQYHNPSAAKPMVSHYAKKALHNTHTNISHTSQSESQLRSFIRKVHHKLHHKSQQVKSGFKNRKGQLSLSATRTKFKIISKQSQMASLSLGSIYTCCRQWIKLRTHD